MSTENLGFDFGDDVAVIGEDNFSQVMRDKDLVFKAEENIPYRLSPILWPKGADGKPDFQAEKPIWIAASRVYIKGVGQVIASPKNVREYENLAGEEAKPYAASLFVEWPVTRKGAIDKDALKEGEINVWPFVVPLKKYNSLAALNARSPFNAHDLALTCTNKQFQAMEFRAEQGNLYISMCQDPDKATSKLVLKKVQDAMAALVPNLSDAIGKRLTISEIKTRLAAARNGAAGGAAGGGSTNLAAAASAASSVQDLLADALGDD